MGFLSTYKYLVFRALTAWMKIYDASYDFWYNLLIHTLGYFPSNRGLLLFHCEGVGT